MLELSRIETLQIIEQTLQKLDDDISNFQAPLYKS